MATEEPRGSPPRQWNEHTIHTALPSDDPLIIHGCRSALQDALQAVDEISLDLLPADLDLDDAADTPLGADDSGTDTGDPEALHAKPLGDAVLLQAAHVRHIPFVA